MNHRSQGPSRQGERSIAPRHANAKVFFTRGKALRDRFSTLAFPVLDAGALPVSKKIYGFPDFVRTVFFNLLNTLFAFLVERLQLEGG